MLISHLIFNDGNQKPESDTTVALARLRSLFVTPEDKRLRLHWFGPARKELLRFREIESHHCYVRMYLRCLHTILSDAKLVCRIGDRSL